MDLVSHDDSPEPAEWDVTKADTEPDTEPEPLWFLSTTDSLNSIRSFLGQTEEPLLCCYIRSSAHVGFRRIVEAPVQRFRNLDRANQEFLDWRTKDDRPSVELRTNMKNTDAQRVHSGER